jgi:predicted metalloprotease with PDZ domain
MTVPGTYAVLDYGRYIENFTAIDKNNKPLPIKKSGNNSYIIQKANEIAKISYIVNDSWDAGTKKNKIFEPAGTNIQESRNFVLNAGGWFGYFQGMENIPVSLTVQKPSDVYGITVLPSEDALDKQIFVAENYHQLVDCPIMFSKPDTASFTIRNARVRIAVFNEAGIPRSAQIYQEVKTSMQAISDFLGGDLPVTRYDFIIYMKDYTQFKSALEGNPGLKTMLKLYKAFKGQGFGALEHGNSSFYFFPEFGNDFVVSMVKDVCIHEFLHILQPLSLHSEHIGNFNYAKPIMSQHLWLYEGITEYFAGISQVRGKVLTQEQYIQGILKSKIQGAESYPNDMPFTEMSKNVFKNPYKKQYPQVYVRGALMGAMLDIEIIRLTNGQKTLKDVILTLVKRYGKDKSFSEDGFIKEFVAEVHPDLQTFFDNYITGKTPLDVKKSLSYVGIEYTKEQKITVPKNPVKDNDVSTERSIVQKPEYKIAHIGKKERLGLQVGDIIKEKDVRKVMYDEEGRFLSNGTKTVLTVYRNGNPVQIPYTVEYTEKPKTIKHQIINTKNKSESQDKYYQKWLNN